jgi:hypothetical protein
LLFSASASAAAASRTERLWRGAFRGALVVAAVYVLLCLRLTWFAEWRWNADNRRLHDAGAWWARTCGTETVASSWHFLSGWNFYESMSGRRVAAAQNKDEVRGARTDVWLLLAGFDEPLIEERGLRVVWRGDSGAMVAVSSACSAHTAQGPRAPER